MFRRNLFLIAVSFLVPGCVYVTHPLSDPDKAEPDKELLGKWNIDLKASNFPIPARFPDQKQATPLWIIESVAIKGNPKGMMHCRYRVADQVGDFWFFPTTIGKNKFWTICCNSEEKELAFGGGLAVTHADFGQEGAYARWTKRDLRLYQVALYKVEKDRLTVAPLGGDQFERVMKAEVRPAGNTGKGLKYFKTAPGWLAKYLEENGPEGLFGPPQIWHRPRTQKALTLSDVKITSTKMKPIALEFTMKIAPGTEKLNALWVALGSPDRLKIPPTKESTGFTTPGVFSLKRCKLVQVPKDSTVFQGKVVFDNHAWNSDTGPVSFLAIDDQNNPSNQIVLQVDFKTGKASERQLKN
jgi:hypothetical protein